MRRLNAFRLVCILVLAEVAGSSQVQNESQPFALSICPKLSRGQRLVGWGKYGLHFVVTRSEVEVSGGKPDVDYVRYVVKPKQSDSVLELWFGGYSLSASPNSEKVSRSSRATQSKVLDTNGMRVGQDNKGFMADGTQWRQFVVRNEGATYDKASQDDAVIFNRIISTACEVPQPRR